MSEINDLVLELIKKRPNSTIDMLCFLAKYKIEGTYEKRYHCVRQAVFRLSRYKRIKKTNNLKPYKWVATS